MMNVEEHFAEFMAQNKEGMRLALLHGNFEGAAEQIFKAGYDCGEAEGMVEYDRLTEAVASWMKGEEGVVE